MKVLVLFITLLASNAFSMIDVYTLVPGESDTQTLTLNIHCRDNCDSSDEGPRDICIEPGDVFKMNWVEFECVENR